jgi:hypothetical protein
MSKIIRILLFDYTGRMRPQFWVCDRILEVDVSELDTFGQWGFADTPVLIRDDSIEAAWEKAAHLLLKNKCGSVWSCETAVPEPHEPAEAAGTTLIWCLFRAVTLCHLDFGDKKI